MKENINEIIMKPVLWITAPFRFHRANLIIKFGQYLNKGVAEEDLIKVYKAQKYLKKHGVAKYFTLKKRS